MVSTDISELIWRYTNYILKNKTYATSFRDDIAAVMKPRYSAHCASLYYGQQKPVSSGTSWIIQKGFTYDVQQLESRPSHCWLLFAATSALLDLLP